MLYLRLKLLIRKSEILKFLSIIPKLKGIQKLRSLFKGNRSRSEIVATFLAALELCKTNNLSIEDTETGEDPNVRLLKNPDANDEVTNDGTN